MPTISEAFGELSIPITHSQIYEIEKFAIHFVLRDTHPLTFDGPFLGVNPVAFKTSDYNHLFEIFGLRRQDVELKIREIPSIDRSFIVTSDPFNLLCIWLVHLAPIYITNKKIAHDFQLNVLKLFHYKIFCSVVNNSFRYGANEGIMTATIAELSRKSDIIRLESWRKLIDTHCEKMLDPNDRFYKTIVEGGPDDLFLRVISENQTALRAKIVTFANAYYESHVEGRTITSTSSVSTNGDGEKILAQTASVIDSATQAMVAEILNPNMFVHDINVDDVAKLFTTISPRMLKTTLFKINETAVLQASAKIKIFDKVETTKDGVLYVGVRALVIEIIRSMIRICRERRINMGSHGLVFTEMRNAFSSSRNLDTDVNAIKRSVEHLIDPYKITSNDASKSALRLAVIYYLQYRTLLKMK